MASTGIRFGVTWRRTLREGKPGLGNARRLFDQMSLRSMLLGSGDCCLQELVGSSTMAC